MKTRKRLKETKGIIITIIIVKPTIIKITMIIIIPWEN